VQVRFYRQVFIARREAVKQQAGKYEEAWGGLPAGADRTRGDRPTMPRQPAADAGSAIGTFPGEPR